MPVRTTISKLRPVKKRLGLMTSGAFCIPHECEKVYVGQTGRNTETRCKEHIKNFSQKFHQKRESKNICNSFRLTSVFRRNYSGCKLRHYYCCRPVKFSYCSGFRGCGNFLYLTFFPSAKFFLFCSLKPSPR